MAHSTFQAGRELDAQVAQEVMGCRVYRVARPDGEVIRYRCDCAKGTPELAPHSDDFIEHTIKPYSKDMRAAWDVVGRLNALGWLLAMCYQRPSPPGYYVAFTKGDNEPARGEANSIQIALCQAALEVVGRG